MTDLEAYRAARQRAAFIDLSARGRIVLRGDDRASWLQGLLTNDVAALDTGEGCYSAWLTPQGRMTADMNVVNLGGELLLDVDASVTARLLDRLRELVFTEDVTVEDRTAAWRAVGVHGPEAVRIVADVVRPAAGGTPVEAEALGRQPEHRQWFGRFGDARVAAVRSNEIGEIGFVLYADAAAARPLAEALAAAGAAGLDAETFAVLRLEAGRPAFPGDMDDSTIPLEAGIEARAVSQTKGCYVGQEVIVRILHRGQGRVARRLVGLLLDDGPPPDAGAPLFAADRPDAEPVGRVTTARRSPALGRTIALGYVKRELAAPGTGLAAQQSGRRVAAVVAARPFLPLPTAAGDSA